MNQENPGSDQQQCEGNNGNVKEENKAFEKLGAAVQKVKIAKNEVSNTYLKQYILLNVFSWKSLSIIILNIWRNWPM
jgi:hypothetical protein